MRRELAGYQQFAALTEQIVEVNEAICEARPAAAPAAGAPPGPRTGRRKRGLRARFAAEAAAEVERLAALAARCLRAGEGLAAVELAIRTAMTRLGAGLLEDLLALDAGYGGPAVDCGAGHQARFVSYRDKVIDTVLGPVTVRRAYYHCGQCPGGVVPRDAELGTVHASLSPGLRSMAAHAATAVPFARAAALLAELAGVSLTIKRVERSAEADGAAARAAQEAESAAILARRVIPFRPCQAPGTLYIEVDGTGVPMTPAETAGRPGKADDGRAHTREVKLACLFTQTKYDEKGRPVADPASPATWPASGLLRNSAPWPRPKPGAAAPRSSASWWSSATARNGSGHWRPFPRGHPDRGSVSRPRAPARPGQPPGLHRA